MISNCQKEIIELHRFFEQWFNGNINDTDQSFSRLSSVLSSQFKMITPNAKIIDRDTLLNQLKSAYGKFSGSDPSFAIRITHLDAIKIEKNSCLITYEEWQKVEDRSTEKGRLSSALFLHDSSTPYNVRWEYLHEVWIGDS